MTNFYFFKSDGDIKTNDCAKKKKINPDANSKVDLKTAIFKGFFLQLPLSEPVKRC